LCALATLLDGYDLAALGIAIPHLAHEAGLAPSRFAVAVSSSMLGMAIGAIFFSPLADRWGRRPLLIAMMLLMGASMIPAMIGNGSGMLAVWRFFTGIGLGATIPVATALTSEYAPDKNRASIVTLMICFAGVGSLLAGLLAPSLAAKWGWRGIFGFGALLPLASAGLFLIFLPESPQFLGREPTKNPRAQNLSPGQIQRTLRPPYRFLTLLLCAVYSLNLFVNLALISWLPSLLTAAHWTTAQASRTTALVFFGGIGGSLVLAYIADRGHSVAALISAYLLAATSLAAIAMLTGTVWIWTTLLFVTGACTYGAILAIGALTASFYPVHLRSSGLGITTGTARFFSVFALFGMGALMRANVSSGTIIGLLLIPMCLCACCMTLLTRAIQRSRAIAGSVS